MTRQRGWSLPVGVTLLAALVLALAGLTPGTARAASITVTTTADTLDAAGGICPSVTLASLPGPDGQTSLREAVCAANNNAGPDTITFSVNGTFALTGSANEDNGGAGDLDIKQSLAVNGNGIANTIIDGSGIERIFDVFPSAASTFDLSNLTLQNGDTRSTSFKEGGALYLHNNVTSTFNSIQVINNFAGANGAIENRGALNISNSLISNNQTIPTSGSVTGGGMHNAGTLSINNTTISNNTVRGEGGGIATSTGVAVTVSITNTTISGNTASVTGGGNGNGGGIATTGNQGTINITNSTISGNHADNNGGGIRLTTPSGGTGNATLTNVTITNNTADFDNNDAGNGGGISQNNAALTLRNTIVAGNFRSTTSTRRDVDGAVVASSSYNLIGVDNGFTGITNGTNNNQIGVGSFLNPRLDPLTNNGGPTETHALQSNSPALDTANNATCPATDQRGTVRPQNTTCDIGAFELVPRPVTTITSLDRAGSNPTNASSVSWTAVFANPISGLTTNNFVLNNITVGGTPAVTTVTPSGSAPTTTWIITVSTGTGDGTLRLRLANDTGLSHSVSNAGFNGQNYNIDRTPPTVDIVDVTPDPRNSAVASISITFDANVDGFNKADLKLTRNGTNIPLGPATLTNTGPNYTLGNLSGLTGTAGTYVLTLTAAGSGITDQAGNALATDASDTWIVDTTAPDTTITGTPPDPSNSSNATFSFTGDDGSGVAGLTFECQLDGGGFGTCTSSQPYSGLSEGSHTFEVRATDAAGNVDQSPASYTWLVDTIPPDTTIDSSPSNPSMSTSASFTFHGDDGSGSGVVSFECQLDSGGFSSCTSAQNYSSLTEGSHTFEVRAVDAAGNADPTPASFTWLVDATPPDTTITATPPNPSTTASASFSFTGNDSGSGVASFQCQLDGGGFSACTSPQNYTDLGEGSHTFQVRAVDNAGNVDPTPATYTWLVDTKPPTVTINQAAGQADPTGDLTIHFTAVFSEPVTGFGDSAADVTIVSTAGAVSAVVTQLSPFNGTTYDIAVSGMTVEGTITVSIPAGTAQDAVANPNTPSTSTDNSVTFVFATQLDLVSGTTTYGDTTATLTARLRRQGSNLPLAGQTIVFTLAGQPVCGGATGRACPVTNAQGVATLTGVPVTKRNAGTYPNLVCATFAAAGGFRGTGPTCGPLTVTRKILWLKPTDRTVALRAANPPTDPHGDTACPAPTYCLVLTQGSSFAPGDTWASLSLVNLRFQYSRNPPATNAAERVGSTYRITAFGATSGNYDIRYEAGTLTVVAAP